MVQTRRSNKGLISSRKKKRGRQTSRRSRQTSSRSRKTSRRSRKTSRRRQTNRKQTYRKRNRRKQEGGADPLVATEGMITAKTADSVWTYLNNDIQKVAEKNVWTPLMKAVQYGKHGAGMMRLLLNDSGEKEICLRPDVNCEEANIKDKKGRTALMLAALYGKEHGAAMMSELVNPNVVQLLRANANEQDNKNRTALMYAARHGAGTQRR